MISTHLSKNFFIAASILTVTILFSASIVLRAQAQSSGNASLSFKKDPASGLFILTVRDPQGIQEFSVKAPDKSSYGGGRLITSALLMKLILPRKPLAW